MNKMMTSPTETTAPQAGNVSDLSESATKDAFMSFQPSRLRRAALPFAVLSSLWLVKELLFIGSKDEHPALAMAGTSAVYYSLLAAGAFTRPRRDYFDLRFGRLLAIMTAMPVVLLVVYILPDEDHLFAVFLDAVGAMLAVVAVFSGLRKFAPPPTAPMAPSRFGRSLQRCFALASRILSPHLLLLAGSALIFISAWPSLSSADKFLFTEQWITSSDYVSWQWEPAVLLRDYAARVAFVLSLGLGVVTVWVTAKNLVQRQPIGPSRLTAYLALLAAILASYAQIDAFYAFLGLFRAAALPVVYVVWLATVTTCLVIVAGSRIQTAVMDGRAVVFLLLLGFPMLVHACTLLPGLTLDTEYAISGPATSYLAVALLAWGWLKANTGRPFALTNQSLQFN
jgi:hypothetical protein